MMATFVANRRRAHLAESGPPGRAPVCVPNLTCSLASQTVLSLHALHVDPLCPEAWLYVATGAKMEADGSRRVRVLPILHRSEVRWTLMRWEGSTVKRACCMVRASTQAGRGAVRRDIRERGAGVVEM